MRQPWRHIILSGDDLDGGLVIFIPTPEVEPSTNMLLLELCSRLYLLSAEIDLANCMLKAKADREVLGADITKLGETFLKLGPVVNIVFESIFGGIHEAGSLRSSHTEGFN